MTSKVDELLSRLRSLPPDTWQTEAPTPEIELAALQDAFGLTLPDDYRGILSSTNGGWLRGRPTPLGIGHIELLWDLNDDPEFSEHLGDVFIFGNDGGGHLYFFDVYNRLGKGAYAVFWVPMGSLFRQDMVYLGPTLTAVIDRILTGEDFNQLEPLGDVHATP